MSVASMTGSVLINGAGGIWGCSETPKEVLGGGAP